MTTAAKTMSKAELEDALCTLLHQEARNLGYAGGANLGTAVCSKIHRMTKVQLQQEIDRHLGKITLQDLPKDHICILIGT